jgi:hypothetical protein
MGFISFFIGAMLSGFCCGRLEVLVFRSTSGMILGHQPVKGS